jgi:hypothetical protein
VSQENVELVLVYLAPDADYVQLYGDDGLWTQFAEVLVPFGHADFEYALHALGSERRYTGGLDLWRSFVPHGSTGPRA